MYPAGQENYAVAHRAGGHRRGGAELYRGRDSAAPEEVTTGVVAMPSESRGSVEIAAIVSFISLPFPYFRPCRFFAASALDCPSCRGGWVTRLSWGGRCAATRMRVPAEFRPLLPTSSPSSEAGQLSQSPARAGVAGAAMLASDCVEFSFISSFARRNSFARPRRRRSGSPARPHPARRRGHVVENTAPPDLVPRRRPTSRSMSPPCQQPPCRAPLRSCDSRRRRVALGRRRGLRRSSMLMLAGRRRQAYAGTRRAACS